MATSGIDDRSIPASLYILAVTEGIGQDEAKVSSRILPIDIPLESPAAIKELSGSPGVFHGRALAITCSYAIASNIDPADWDKESEYLWY